LRQRLAVPQQLRCSPTANSQLSRCHGCRHASRKAENPANTGSRRLSELICHAVTLARQGGGGRGVERWPADAFAIVTLSRLPSRFRERRKPRNYCLVTLSRCHAFNCQAGGKKTFRPLRLLRVRRAEATSSNFRWLLLSAIIGHQSPLFVKSVTFKPSSSHLCRSQIFGGSIQPLASSLPALVGPLVAPSVAPKSRIKPLQTLTCSR
jgi:hypothetical protein